MMEHWVEGSKYSSAPGSLSGSVKSLGRSWQRNVFHLLAQREVSPQTKHHARKLWGKTSKCEADSIESRYKATDAKQDLFSWAESQSLHHWSAKYCPLLPPPRSTIAAAFSSDGKKLASTHGDHTVKIIDYQTGNCLKVLRGHWRTPWVVRFHPLYSDILASGSLDHEVRIWDANTSDCIGAWDFYRPIASIAFHASGELLAVASGHKLYVWNYNQRGETSAPAIILRTRRSLRAVHFHPHGAPYLLTAEVNDPYSADSPLTLATSSGYSKYPSTVFFANISSSCSPHLESMLSSPSLLWPAYLRDDGSVCLLHNDWASGSANLQQRVSSLAQNLTPDVENQHADQFVTPMDVCPGEPSGSNDMTDDSSLSARIGTHTVRGQLNPSFPGSNCDNNFERSSARDNVQMSFQGGGMPVLVTAAPSFITSSSLDVQIFLRNADIGHNPFGDSPSWELPFLQGWLMAQSHAGFRPAPLNNNVVGDLPLGSAAGAENLTSASPYMHNLEHLGASPSTSNTTGTSRGSGQHHAAHPQPMASIPGVGSSLPGTQNDESEAHPLFAIWSDFTTSLLAVGATELPCTVKLKMWHHDIRDSCAVLDAEACRLTISHAVLCSEMGAHFSPCGRFLVACVACLLPQTEGDNGSQLPMQYGSTGAGTSPTRHPLPSNRAIYELRIYSLEEATFGKVLASRAIRAAHCLTSIQFSPTSEHILLAYGRRHRSLLKSIVMDGETAIPIYTILEVYRVSDMELVRALPSAEDEVNVACFHPSAGGVLVYGTKEGKLRILECNGGETASPGLNFFVNDNLLEIQRYALEC